MSDELTAVGAEETGRDAPVGGGVSDVPEPVTGSGRGAVERIALRARQRVAALVPGTRTRRGAAAAWIVVALLAMAMWGYDLQSGLGHLLDTTLGVLVGVIGLGVLAGLVAGAMWLAGSLPRVSLAVAAACLVALIFASGLAWRTALPLALIVVAIEGALGTGLAAVRGGVLRDPRAVRRAWALVTLAVGVAGNAVLLWYLASAGSSSHLPPTSATEAWLSGTASPPALELPDPGLPGPLPVRTFTYGAGDSRRRPEFGVDRTYESSLVDLTPYVSLSGWRARVRHAYWGFGLDEAPLNARVWMPDEEQGPYPVVLVVHGNHDMHEQSDPGYAYLAEHLASRGFVVASVDANFLNAFVGGGLRGDNDGRAVLLLEHLRQWRAWAASDRDPFSGMADLDRVVLVGHSRGGEAAAIAALFNRLAHYPENARDRFDYDFGIRGVVAFAPSDRQYEPGGHPLVLEDTSYLVLLGGHDADTSYFPGTRTYDRARVADGGADADEGPGGPTDGEPAAGGPTFKSLLMVHRANHGQFNTVWGAYDVGWPRALLLNHAPLLPGADQRTVADTLVGAFLEVVLHDDDRYRDLLRDYRAGRAWLPSQTAYVSRYADGRGAALADYEEDADPASATHPDWGVRGAGLRRWREKRIDLRGGREGDNHGVELGWSGGRGVYELERRTGDPAELDIPTRATGAQEPQRVNAIAIDVADARPAGEASWDDSLDFTVEIEDVAGVVSRASFVDLFTLPPTLVATVTRWPPWERRYGTSVPMLQTVTLPLFRFGLGSGVPAADIEAIRLRFDRTPDGRILVDNVTLLP